MKKVLAVVCALVLMLALTACSKFECDICGEEKTGKQHKRTILGEKVTMCDDCHEAFEKAEDALRSFSF